MIYNYHTSRSIFKHIYSSDVLYQMMCSELATDIFFHNVFNDFFVI